MDPHLIDAAFVMVVIDSEPPTEQFCLELGTAIMYEKPVIVLALTGAKVPDVLRTLAADVIETEDDELTEDLKAQAFISIRRVLNEPLHDSDFECNECGGPSPETSTSGCQFCDGQGDIVPRGTAKMRTWVPRQQQ